MKIRFLILGMFLAGSCMLSAQQDLTPKLNEVKSRLQSMSEGYYTDAEWSDLFSDMKILGIRAEARDDIGLQLEVALLRAMGYGDVKKDYDKAREILEEALASFGQENDERLKRVYVRLAEVYSIQQDGPSIERIKARFKSSPVYDIEIYDAWGGTAPGVPVTLVRGDEDAGSSTLTAIQKFQDSGAIAVGSVFPEFTAADHRKNSIRLSNFEGKVVLVDFWIKGWKPWEKDLPNLRNAYKNYRKDGFEVIGICLDPDIERGRAAINDYKLPWSNIAGNPALPRRYTVFGEATRFLLNRNGSIVGKNQSGAILVDAIKEALEEE